MEAENLNRWLVFVVAVVVAVFKLVCMSLSPSRDLDVYAVEVFLQQKQSLAGAFTYKGVKSGLYPGFCLFAMLVSHSHCFQSNGSSPVH